MDFLADEINRKRKILSSASTGKSKYIKLGDLRRQEEEESGDENQIQEETKPQELIKPCNIVKESGGKTDDKIEDNVNKQKDSKKYFSGVEIRDKLRSLGEPVTLFGESAALREIRLRSLLREIETKNEANQREEEFRLGSGHSIRNTFVDRTDEKYKTSLEESVTNSNAVKKQLNKYNGALQAESTLKDTKKEEENDPHKRIYRFFKDLLKDWEQELVDRSDAVKRTVQGKNETNTWKQCKDYIWPLFKLCKKRELEPSIMTHILNIVEHCEAGEFVRANDSYMDVAIGRAAWPIGVTMVGIHERTGRSKIQSANVAHVMNSELQRKYLTSVKRLMSYCQKKRKDVAPSKKVT